MRNRHAAPARHRPPPGARSRPTARARGGGQARRPRTRAGHQPRRCLRTRTRRRSSSRSLHQVRQGNAQLLAPGPIAISPCPPAPLDPADLLQGQPLQLGQDERRPLLEGEPLGASSTRRNSSACSSSSAGERKSAGWVGRPREVRQQGPAFLEGVQAAVPGDRQQPGAERRPVQVEGGEAHEGGQEDVLRDVLTIGGSGQQVADNAEDGCLMALDQLAERGRFAAAEFGRGSSRLPCPTTRRGDGSPALYNHVGERLPSACRPAVNPSFSWRASSGRRPRRTALPGSCRGVRPGTPRPPGRRRCW